jgi:hypothetical protein
MSGKQLEAAMSVAKSAELMGGKDKRIKHMAQNLLRKAPGKDSLRLRRKVAAWDDDFLVSLLSPDS